VATGLGFGYSRFAPGTVGALWGIPLTWALEQIPATGPVPAAVWQALVIVILCWVGIPICTRAARELGSKKDPRQICYDEIVSVPITFFLLSATVPDFMTRPSVWAAGFVLNRICDILKPPPARQWEAWPEGLGIMADDWIAGLYSNLLLHLLVYLGYVSLMSRFGI